MRALIGAVALASVALGRQRQSAFEPATCVHQQQRAPIEYVRCYCPQCVRADVREAWGAWQYRLL